MKSLEVAIQVHAHLFEGLTEEANQADTFPNDPINERNFIVHDENALGTFHNYLNAF
jgi:hypothetical protein